MLSNVKPIRCKLVKEPYDRQGWIFEIKWDGFRAVAEVSQSEVRLFSRNHRSFARQFAEVVSSLERLSRKHEAVLDGEWSTADRVKSGVELNAGTLRPGDFPLGSAKSRAMARAMCEEKKQKPRIVPPVTLHGLLLLPIHTTR
jgi:hypothetical protein